MPHARAGPGPSDPPADQERDGLCGRLCRRLGLYRPPYRYRTMCLRCQERQHGRRRLPPARLPRRARRATQAFESSQHPQRSPPSPALFPRGGILRCAAAPHASEHPSRPQRSAALRTAGRAPQPRAGRAHSCAPLAVRLNARPAGAQRRSWRGVARPPGLCGRLRASNKYCAHPEGRCSCQMHLQAGIGAPRRRASGRDRRSSAERRRQPCAMRRLNKPANRQRAPPRAPR
mmetsp:Transcript_20016/g.65026  ORF Transcript_20016/g.65026 Transcript_20016/m.65026 type:complete len:232 (+) Transcript_20016:1160-1855(+)